MDAQNKGQTMSDFDQEFETWYESQLDAGFSSEGWRPKDLIHKGWTAHREFVKGCHNARMANRVNKFVEVMKRKKRYVGTERFSDEYIVTYFAPNIGPDSLVNSTIQKQLHFRLL